MEDFSSRNEFSSIEVNCGAEGGQSTWISVSVLYGKNSKKVVDLWNDGVAKTYKYVILKRSIIEAVNRNSRHKEALSIYSGSGFNLLRDEIMEYLQSDENLNYFDIHRVTIYKIRLNKEYEDEIALKQLAKQSKLEFDELAKAAVEEAKQAKANAQIAVEKVRAKALADQVAVIKKAEGEKGDRIFAAKAKKEQDRLDGEGIEAKNVAEAEGILALGKANALVEEEKKKAMYSDEAGLLRSEVEIATALAGKLSGVMSGVNLISKKF